MIGRTFTFCFKIAYTDFGTLLVVIYDVIKSMIMQLMIILLQILIWPMKPHDLSLYKIWSYLDQLKQSYGPMKLEDFLLCYVGKWACGHSFAHQHGCRNINVWKFLKFWTAVTLVYIGTSTRNLQRPFEMGLSTLCKNFVQKSLIKIFDDVIANQEFQFYEQIANQNGWRAVCPLVNTAQGMVYGPSYLK